MTTRKPDSNGPEDVDAAFAAIIADLEREGIGRDVEDTLRDDPRGPQSGRPGSRTDDPSTAQRRDDTTERPSGDRPATDRPPSERPSSTDRPPTVEPPKGDTPQGWRTADVEWDPDAADDLEDEHYEPPEPPPLPKLHASTIVALLLIAIAILLFVAPGVLGMQSTASIPIATVALVGAAGLLLFRLRTGNPPGSPGSDDDGARL